VLAALNLKSECNGNERVSESVREKIGLCAFSIRFQGIIEFWFVLRRRYSTSLSRLRPVNVLQDGEDLATLANRQPEFWTEGSVVLYARIPLTSSRYAFSL
jgi:hypothetical protein